jgi:AcrR family transcriptional regulator
MARRTTITDELILSTAREVFLEEGIQAQTSKIAQRAGISEGTIFKRFATKDELFLAALSIPYPPPWHATLDKLVGVGDIKENLITLGVELLTYFQHVMPNIIASSGMKGLPRPMPGQDDLGENSPLAQDLKSIHFYLSREADLGRIRQMDVEILTTLLFGAFSSPVLQAVFNRIFDKDLLTDKGLREIAKKTIDIIWQGIDPHST